MSPVAPGEPTARKCVGVHFCRGVHKGARMLVGRSVDSTEASFEEGRRPSLVWGSGALTLDVAALFATPAGPDGPSQFDSEALARMKPARLCGKWAGSSTVTEGSKRSFFQCGLDRAGSSSPDCRHTGRRCQHAGANTNSDSRLTAVPINQY